MTKDNQLLVSLIESLARSRKPVWKKVAYELSRPRRKKAEVNLTKIETYADAEATVLVPGKVLGSGTLSKKLTIAAFAFSDNARKLIEQAGGKAVSIDNLYKANPDGRGVIILK